MKEVIIGFLGCGNVGGGVWNLLDNFRKEIAHRNNGLSIKVKKVQFYPGKAFKQMLKDLDVTSAAEALSVQEEKPEEDTEAGA